MQTLHIFSIPTLGPPGLDFSFPPPSQKHTDFLTETYQNEAFPAQGPPGPGFEVQGPDFSFWAPFQKHQDFFTETYQHEAFPAQGPPGAAFERVQARAASKALSPRHPESFRPGVSDRRSS